MTPSQGTPGRTLLSRLIGRLNPYVHNGTLRLSRVDRVLASLVLKPTDRDDLKARVLAALEASGIELVDDRVEVYVPNADGRNRPQPLAVAEPTVDDEAKPTADWLADEPDAEELAEAAILVQDQDLAPVDAIYLDDGDVEPSCGRLEVLPDGEYTYSIEVARRFLIRRRGLRTPHAVLLTAQQEVGLGVLMRPPGSDLTRDLDEHYRPTLANGSEAADAYDALVVHNMRLVLSIARKYQGTTDQAVALDDIVSYGYFGLIRAVQKFDVTMGFKFSTYATWWIRQSVLRSIMDFGRAIRLPVHLGEKINRTRAASERIQIRGQWPTVARLALETGYSQGEIRKHLEWEQGIYSLDAPVGVDGATLSDFLVDHRQDDGGLTGLEHQLMREDIDALLDSLSARERGVIVLRYGLQGDDPWTLEAIGREMNVTRERIRQIEGKAISKLQGNTLLSGLRVYVWP